MTLGNLVIAKGPLSGDIFIGKLNKKKDMFLHKKEITSMFLGVVLQYFEPGTVTEVQEGNRKFNVSVEEVTTELEASDEPK